MGKAAIFLFNLILHILVNNLTNIWKTTNWNTEQEQNNCKKKNKKKEKDNIKQKHRKQRFQLQLFCIYV